MDEQLIKKAVAPGRTLYRRADDLEAEAHDPYAMGYDAAADLDNPGPCPFRAEGMAAKLWRKGFSDRIDLIIADKRRWGGLDAVIT